METHFSDTGQTMSPPDDSTTLTLNDTHAEENRMRAALGLTPQHAPPSQPADWHPRPGRESEPSVTIVTTRRTFETSDSSRARIAVLQDELKAERGERVAAQQALADARQTIQQLQTKLAHTEMAAAEALEAEQKARLAAEARLLDLASATAPQPKPQTLAELKRRGRPPGKRVEKESEQQPVQWWLPSYATSKAKRSPSKA